MTNIEKRDLLKIVFGGKEEVEVLDAYLTIAGGKILNRIFPFDNTKGESDIPEKYHTRQVDIAAYLLNKRGAEGEIRHSENGIDRSYESADVPESMLRDIVPYCEVM